MNIFKQNDIKIPLFAATLENGVNINVYGDYAEGSDGKTYYHVGREDEEGDLQTIGWSCEVSEAVILEE